MNCEIHPISKDGLEDVVDVLMRIDTDTIGERWEKGNFLVELPGKWRCSWAAVQDGRTVAFVIASRKADSIHVHRIAVAREVRGRGIGSVLLERVAQCAEELDMPWVTLRVAADNVGAVRFYDRLGFESQDSDLELLNLRIAADSLRDAART